MRRKDRKLSQDDTIQVLRAGEYGILATYGENGYPYGVPLSYVYQDGKVYFHGATSGHKLDNLRHCEKASFTVVGHTHVLQEAFSTTYQSTIAFGKVHLVEQDQKEEVLRLLAEKYCRDNLDNAERYIEKMLGHVGVYCMEIEQLSGKARPDIRK